MIIWNQLLHVLIQIVQIPELVRKISDCRPWYHIRSLKHGHTHRIVIHDISNDVPYALLLCRITSYFIWRVL